MGTLTFDEAYDIILEQVETVKDQVDLVLFETMSDLYEVKAGVLAVKEHTDLPVFVTMTFEQNGRTLSGNDPETFINVAEGLGVDALGVNCSLGPDELKPIIDEILEKASIPVMLQPMPDFQFRTWRNTLSCDTRRICGIYERLYGKRCSNRWWMLWNNTRIYRKTCRSCA